MPDATSKSINEMKCCSIVLKTKDRSFPAWVQLHYFATRVKTEGVLLPFLVYARSSNTLTKLKLSAFSIFILIIKKS